MCGSSLSFLRDPPLSDIAIVVDHLCVELFFEAWLQIQLHYQRRHHCLYQYTYFQETIITVFTKQKSTERLQS